MKLEIKDLELMKIRSPRSNLHNLNDALRLAEINTIPRFIGFMMNILHESGSFVHFEEIASGARYEGRLDLGNTNPGDGKKYKGRGAIMITGRNQYFLFSKYVNNLHKRGINYATQDFVADPQKVSLSEFALLSAAYFWETNNLNQWCDKEDYKTLMNLINTGVVNGRKTNGVQDRLAKQEVVEKWVLKIFQDAEK